MGVPLLIPTVNVTTSIFWPFGPCRHISYNDVHAGWRMGQFRLGYAGQRLSTLGEDMRLALRPHCPVDFVSLSCPSWEERVGCWT